jgi:cytochrome b involved in lipid metabolism
MTAAAVVALAAATVVTTTSTADCHENTPSVVAEEDLEQVTSLHEMDNLPVYSSDQVAQHNGEDGTRIWMTYGGVVYDVTDFIPNHPGGSEQILKASGNVSTVDKVNVFMIGKGLLAATK